MIKKDVVKLSEKIKKTMGNTKPSLKLKLTFKIMQNMQKSNDWNPTDRDYWKDKGWLEKNSPGNKKYFVAYCSKLMFCHKKCIYFKL